MTTPTTTYPRIPSTAQVIAMTPEDQDIAALVAELAGEVDTTPPTAEELAEIYRSMLLSAEEIKLLRAVG